MWKSLQVKFLLCVIPLFVLASAAGLSWLAEYDIRRNLDDLAARVGNHAAYVASALARASVLDDEAIASRVLATLLADRAVLCAELDAGQSGVRQVLAPRGVGCLGQGEGERLELALDGLEQARLIVRFSTKEIAEARTARREFSLLVTALGFVLAVGCSSIGFYWAVSAPLRRLLVAIRETSTSGQFNLVDKVGSDEIGQVTEAFNIMQLGLQSRSERLSHMARHDMLTGLANRVLLRERMEQLLVRSHSSGSTAVLCLDLDGFKGVNDTLGHPAGDELLRQVAGRLRENTREADLVVRLGGDEFTILQVDADRPADVTALAERLVSALHHPFDIKGQKVTIGTSIGVVLVDAMASSADELLRRADLALYRAKAAGRGTWRLFHPEMDAAVKAQCGVDAGLPQALQTGRSGSSASVRRLG
ncbi:diguanylate cyclase domain-containing protein [Roseomonas sp. GCM10028921]